jgi:type I restriction enzyme M protein
MITGALKSQIDQVWNAFWSGGISNPLTVIEQITYLLFTKRLDEIHTGRERRANRLGRPLEDPIFGPEKENLRWSRFKDLEAGQMFELFRDKVFPFIKDLHNGRESVYSRFMKDAVFVVPTPTLLQRVVTMLDAIPMEDRDTKGDLYEYMLSKIATAGQNGQFRTPRHIIKMMVDLVAPTPRDTIADPACGTCGFLVAAGEYLREHHPEIAHDEVLRRHFNEGMFHGVDFDSSMLRIGAMNMTLHGVEGPDIRGMDSLSQDGAGIRDRYTVVLANPPFKGSLDYESVAKDLLTLTKTKKTELLFLALFLRQLKAGGRGACIVPDGVLFGSSNAHREIRKHQVWFYDMVADGYSLDDKREPVAENDIPDILAKWKARNPKTDSNRSAKAFFVPKAEITAHKYDLSINRYKEIEHAAVEYDPPLQILDDVDILVGEVQRDLRELREMVG